MDNQNPNAAVRKALDAAKNILNQRDGQPVKKYENKRIYISVPMADNPNAEAEAQAVEDILITYGHRPVNPVKISKVMKIQHPDWTPADFLLHDLRILKDCDGIFMCKGWQNSYGCGTELNFADFIKNRMNPDFMLRGDLTNE